MCPTTGIAYKTPEPNSFSFNSPKGACKHCNGIGFLKEVDEQKIIPDKSKSINQGAIAPITKRKSEWITKQLEVIGKKYNFTLNTPMSRINKAGMRAIFYGENGTFNVKLKSVGVSKTYKLHFNGIINFIKEQARVSYVKSIERWANNYMSEHSCPECEGSRLNKESMHFKVGDKQIYKLTAMDISSFSLWISNIENELNKKQKIIAKRQFKCNLII